jgi:hypothetical protein
MKYITREALNRHRWAIGGRGPAQMRVYETVLAEYPHLVEVVGGYVAESGYDYASEFLFGLDVILDGLGRLLQEAADSQRS